jgi:Domain of unknown function (DUF4252)
MNKWFITSGSRNWVILPLAFSFALTIYAQDPRIQVNHLDRLAAVAIESVEITLDELRMRAVSKLMTLSAKDQTKLMDLMGRLKGVYIRGFEFANDGEYTESDVDTIRAQLNAPGWQRIVEVRGRNGDKNEFYLMPLNDTIVGYTAIFTEPRKLCVINIVGQINVDEMHLLDNQFELKKCGIGMRTRNR